MSMTDPYRSMCAELIEAIDSETADWEDIEELKARARALLAQPVAEGSDAVHPFVVRHYTDDERPSIKGNGFDGLEIGEDRQESEEFIAWINKRICPTPQPPAELAEMVKRLHEINNPTPQPVAEGPKPVVDYSRVPEIATEAQIRSAAQYLVKKRNCDGDLIPAIEYAIARWGCPTAQPKPEGPTDEEIMELMPQHMRDDLAQAARAMTGVDMASFDTPKAAGLIRIILNRHAVDHARAVLAKWGCQ